MQLSQNFYRKDIIDNAPNVEMMKTSVLTTPFYCMATNNKPMLSKCPDDFITDKKRCKQTPTSYNEFKTIIERRCVKFTGDLFPINFTSLYFRKNTKCK